MRHTSVLRLLGFVLLTAFAMWGLNACGRASGPESRSASGAATTSTTTATSPLITPSTPPGWLTYSDNTYSFRIAFPANFTFKPEGAADPGAGWLAEYRAVDTHYLNTYPPGQVELGIYNYDAGSLADWITKHTGSSSSTNHTLYWQSTSNVQSVSAAGRPAIAFDATVTGFPVPGHSTAFVQNSSRVIVLDWWATDSTYAPSISDVARQMLSSFNG